MQQPSVLIIDESDIERYMLCHQLKRMGVTDIVQKIDGTSGLEFLQDYAQNQQQYGASNSTSKYAFQSGWFRV